MNSKQAKKLRRIARAITTANPQETGKVYKQLKTVYKAKK